MVALINEHLSGPKTFIGPQVLSTLYCLVLIPLLVAWIRMDSGGHCMDLDLQEMDFD